jgi:hypothetical protein
MGSGKSKIPTKYSGQILLLTGFEDYDDFYGGLEKSIRRIKAIRLNIDFRLTDFILNLGAGKLWERTPDFLEILRMLIVVLAVNHKNEVNGISYSQNQPYFICDTSHCPYKIKSLYDNFKDYIQAVGQGILKLNEINENFDWNEIKITLSEHNQEIIKILNESDYKTLEKLIAVENVSENKEKIEEAISSIGKILKLNEDIRRNIEDAIIESKKSPKYEKVIQQCVQARIEKIFSPEEIIRKFWPFPLN